MKKTSKYILFTVVGLFALIGLVFTIVFIGMRFGIFNVRGSIADRNQFFTNLAPEKKVVDTNTPPCEATLDSVCEWNKTPEWNVIREGLTKDADIINRVSKETGVAPRMIVAVVVPEQIRFFTANREVFKRYFEPLKILGSLTQFSLGVSGIKQDTALSIENHIADLNSPYYPGKDMSSLIAYKEGVDHDSELYNRLTDSKNHYYSYLYTALFIQQIETQWQSAGYNVTKSPEAITTLFNLGFGASKPNAYPIAGGAPITTGGKTYLYGELGKLFYSSDELLTLFSR